MSSERAYQIIEFINLSKAGSPEKENYREILGKKIICKEGTLTCIRKTENQA